MSFHDLIRQKAAGASESRKVPEAASAAAAPVREASSGVSGDGRFDPAKYSVKRVVEYVEEHPDEAEAVYQAELSGKARSSLLSALGE